MRKLVLLFSLTASTSLLQAQSVGIGTTTPNASAQLDVASTTRGFLIPRMTSINRAFITNPANGLLVYDTTQNRIYQYQDGTWRYLINDSYWRVSSSHKWMYNTTDSIGVGVGTSTPTQRLDINGNIRSRDDLLADGRVIATGIVSGSSLQTPGNLAVSGIGIINGNVTTNSDLSVGGTSLLTGNVTTNNDLIVNNTAATLQLKASGVDKGFVQLSGDNLRLGTNSSNSDGRIILRSGGTDRLTVFENGNINIGSSAANAAKLRVAGDVSVQDDIHVQNDVNVAGKITRSNLSGNKDFLPVCFGKIGEDGSVISGSGNFTVTTTPGYTGQYDITCTGITSTVICVGTARYACVIYMNYVSGNTVKVYSKAISDGFATPSPFSFIMYKGD
ncbi:MAG: hypothetical protein JNK14_18165 [Chitinophagaceae bacterium]|nr:hypothetical protein [Chitinophagaceae bacterium]